MCLMVNRVTAPEHREMMTQEPTFHVGKVPIYGPLVLAPLAGYSDHPYRTICRRMGSAMSYTEFVSAHGVVRRNHRTFEILRFGPQERPVVLQIFGCEPELLTEACLVLQDMGPDIIDINLGCPSPRISLRGSGAGLLKTPQKIASIFSSLSKHLSVPVTAKIRLGWDRDTRNYLEIARILEDNGAALIAVHGRTRQDSYKTPADWDAIAEVKQSVGIPVLGNGDVHCVDDVDRMKRHTHCDGVMIGRGAIGNPWIFAGRDLCDVPVKERAAVIREHLTSAVLLYGEHRGVLTFRKHVLRYIRGIPGASKLRAELIKCVTVDQVFEQLDRFMRPAPDV
jgi:tRNA-dihydrouridine synthase B